MSVPLTALVVVIVAGWLLAYLVLVLRTRSRAVPPAPATPELAAEPPAVVNLLANRWRLTGDAAEATLLDLAARGFLELHQNGPDPVDTTVWLRSATTADAARLLPFERRVLDRVRQLAVDGAVPVTALTFRDPREAAAWHRRLRAEIVADARARGLSRARFGARTRAVMSAGAGAAAALPIGVGVLQDLLPVPVVFVGLMVGAGLSHSLTRLPHRERDTPAGRTAAAHWLGVRRWLRGHDGFAGLPPAAVAVWDRYLAYGAALGTTGATSAVLDLGLGSHRLVWSSYLGHWRRVRIRYPALGFHYGRSFPQLLLLTVGMVVASSVLSCFGWVASGLTGAAAPAPVRVAGWAALAAVGLAAVYLLYVWVRALLDLTMVRDVTGEVLWVKVARMYKSKGARHGTPYLYHVAVDDGTADTTVAWGLPRDAAGGIRPGDVVQLRVRPWVRRVVGLRVLRAGPGRQPVETAPPGHAPAGHPGS